MKRIQLLSVFLFLFSITSFAQPGSRLKERLQQKKDNIKSMKIAFITSELSLTPDEATKFWPLFNAFEDKQKDIKKDRVKNYMDRIDAENLSEKEASTLVNQMESTEEELYQVRKKFITSLKTVLPATKILKLRKAEEEFSKRLLQQYRDKKTGK